MAEPAGMHALHSALGERIGTHVKRLEQLIIAAKTEALRPLGVTVPQYAALFAISHLQPTSGAQLARAVLTTPQTMSTILNNLAAKDLIVRDVSAIHQKLFEVRLTPAGEDLVRQCDGMAVRIETGLREAIGDDRFRILTEISKIVESAIPSTEQS
jgi:DNA-binding MarR family transcriptional regulator